MIFAYIHPVTGKYEEDCHPLVDVSLWIEKSKVNSRLCHIDIALALFILLFLLSFAQVGSNMNGSSSVAVIIGHVLSSVFILHCHRGTFFTSMTYAIILLCSDVQKVASGPRQPRKESTQKNVHGRNRASKRSALTVRVHTMLMLRIVLTLL